MPIILGYSLFQAVFGSSTTNAIHSWLSENDFNEDELKKSHSLIEIASKVGMASGPLFGVLLLQLFNSPKIVFLIDTLTYVIGAILISGLKSSINLDKIKKSFYHEVKEGFQYVFQNKEILRWISVSVLQGFGLAVMNAVYLTILKDRIRADDSKITFFQTAYFIGGLLGGIFAFKIKLKTQSLLMFSNLVLAFVPLVSIFTKSYVLFFTLAIIQRAMTLSGAVCTRTLCQQGQSREFFGRIMSVRSVAIDVGTIFSYCIVLIFLNKNNLVILLIMGSIFIFGATMISTKKNFTQINSFY